MKKQIRQTPTQGHSNQVPEQVSLTLSRSSSTGRVSLKSDHSQGTATETQWLVVTRDPGRAPGTEKRQ